MPPKYDEKEEQHQRETTALGRQAHGPKAKMRRWTASSRENRRQDILRRQREARRELTTHIRRLVLHALEEQKEERMPCPIQAAEATVAAEEAEQDGEMTAVDMMASETEITNCHGKDEEERTRGKHYHNKTKSRRRDALERAKYFSSQFSIPEWMVEVPHDLNGKDDVEHGRGWFVMARPEGRRCLMVASGGETVTRLQNGEVLHRFFSSLPNGSPSARGPKNGWTILDCIYHEADSTYYILDLLCWRSMELYDCTCEFRLFFLRSKFAEEEIGGRDGSAYRLWPLLYYDCDPSGITEAYGGFVPFQRDGLLFMNKQGYYELGLSPLQLLWKDEKTSRRLPTLTQPLSCVLALLEKVAMSEYVLATLEGQAVGQVTKEEAIGQWGVVPPAVAAECSVGNSLILARFQYETATEDDAEGVEGIGNTQQQLQVSIQGLRFQKKCPPSRAIADPWSKILFNSRARRRVQEAVTIERILQSAARTKDLQENDDRKGM